MPDPFTPNFLLLDQGSPVSGLWPSARPQPVQNWAMEVCEKSARNHSFFPHCHRSLQQSTKPEGLGTTVLDVFNTMLQIQDKYFWVFRHTCKN